MLSRNYVPISLVDLPDFEETLLHALPRYYSGIDTTLPRYYAQAELHGNFQNYSTTRVEVWTCFRNNARAAYLVLVWKRWGTLKIGPCIVKEQHRGIGIGRGFLKLIFTRAEETGVRKIYFTAPAQLTQIIQRCLGAGFVLEAHLKEHYSIANDELVLGYFPGSTFSAAHAPGTRHRHQAVLHAASTSSATAQLLNPNDTAAVAATAYFLQAVMPTQYSGVDDAFVSGLVRNASALNDVTGSHPRHLLMIDRTTTGTVHEVQLLRLKRGQLLLSNVIRQFHTTPMSGASELNRIARSCNVRKVSLQIPVSLAGSAQTPPGYQAEGILRSPYQPGEDVLLLSRFLEPTERAS